MLLFFGSQALFQFTPLCERLLLVRARNFHRSHYFNSRLSARGYQSALLTTAMASQFQFTPLCERLRQRLAVLRRSVNFNSRLSARGYSRITVMRMLFRYFNSRLSARGYNTGTGIRSVKRNFNSRLSARGYLPERTRSQIQLFQFTPLCERLQQKQTIYSCISA